MDFIDLKAQYRKYKAEIDARIQRVLDHGQFILGPEVAEVEFALAAYVGVKHCLTVASGTDSLEIALRALGIGPGDEVITVPFTWISTAEAVALVGAQPVFVDIDPISFNIDVNLIEGAITPRTKALIPVSLFGQMPDYARINAIAAKHGLAVIEDAAQSFGATQRFPLPLTPALSPTGGEGVRRTGEGAIRQSCGVTLIGSTSFFPAKPLGCYGDGGALFTDDAGLADKMRAIRVHGGLKRHEHPMLGMNGRFDALQAAVLLAKFPHFGWEVEQRNQLGARYTELLQESDLREQKPDLRHPAPDRPPSSVVCPQVSPGNTHVYAQYTLRVPDRDSVAEKLKGAGIPTAVYYPKCLHEQPVFAPLGYRWGSFPQAEKASREVLSLPMHPFLSEADQDRIVGALKEAVAAT